MDLLKKISRYVLCMLFLTMTLFAKVTKIDVISFNDFHGNVAEDTRAKGKNIGMAKMVGYVNAAREENPNTIVVSGGDNYQGTAISNLTFGAPVSKMMKSMKVVASAVGNHEFDWGSERIAKWAEEGNFDYLASNIYDKTTKEPVTWAKPYKIVDVDGVKIAFIGLATEQTKYQTKVEFVKNIDFKPAEEAANYWIKYLKSGKAAEGTPEVIIALTHIPSMQDKDSVITGEELDRLTKVEGLDAVVTGHSHRTVSGTMNGKPVVQAYKYGRALGKLHIVMEDGKVKEITPEVDMVSKAKSDIIEDSTMKEQLAKQTAELKEVLGEKLGTLKEDLVHDRKGSLTPLGYWATDVMRKATNTQVGLTNGGGLRRTLFKGDITMGDLYEIMPFDNQLVVVKVKGKDLKALIDHGIDADFMTDGQFAGLKVVYDPAKEYEHKIVKITLEDGTPIEDEKIYTLVTNDFIVTGGDRYDFSNAIEVKDLFVPIRDALVDNIKANGGIAIPDISEILVKVSDVKEEQSPKIYIIQKNDTLRKIATKENRAMKDLIKANKLANPDIIHVGQKLVIPAKAI